MPEGDTVHRLAAALRPAVEGRPVAGVWLRDRGWLAPLAGHVASEVSPLGKHLLVGLAPPGEARARRALHVHLGMKGRLHRYDPGEPWRRPAHQAVARLETEDASWVWFRAATAELLPVGAVALHPALARLGPDLLGPPPDWDRIVARARRREPRGAGDLLLDQRVACGIGNVYKSEVLFLHGVHPRRRVDRIDDDTLGALYRCARRLLRRNLGPWPRATRPGADRRRRSPDVRFFVYDRAGRPCPRCGTRLTGARTGDAARPTFWCPRCQR